MYSLNVIETPIQAVDLKSAVPLVSLRRYFSRAAADAVDATCLCALERTAKTHL